MRLIFAGTPQFAVPTLEALIAAGHTVSLVLSQPDRPVGRSAEVKPTPVKAAALAHGIRAEQPEKIRNNEALRATLEAIAPDAIVVVAYGRILPQWMLDLPRFGCLNGHASLLPRWRGAAPIQWAIAAGDTETGVTTMQLDAGLDTGAMLLRSAVPVEPTTTAPDLFVSLADIGAQLMVETLAGLSADTIHPVAQNDAEATLAPLLTRDDARIEWTRTAKQIDARFRGFQPWPGAFTMLHGRKLSVHAMLPVEQNTKAAPGTILASADALLVASGGGSCLRIDELQLEGKKRMTAAEFLRGNPLKPGERLG